MNYADRIAVAHVTADRVLITKEADCPAEILKNCVLYDTEIDVVVSAAEHPNCPVEVIPESSTKLGLRNSLLITHYVRVVDCSTFNVWERKDLARDPDTPSELIETIINFEKDLDVVLAAAVHPNCPVEVLPKAAELTGVRLSLLLAQSSRNTNFETINPSLNRDGYILSHILNHTDSVNSKLIEQQVHHQTKPKDPSIPIKAHVVLIMCPSWGVAFAPYNIAKLASLLRWQGYKVTVFDMNIKSYHMLREKTEFNFWEAGRAHLWYAEDFKNKILPLVNDYITDVVEEIIKLNPDVVGLSLYATNMWFSKYLLKLLKGLKPNLPVIVGGPEASQEPTLPVFEKGLIDYVFIGEAEELLSNFMENKEYLIPAEKKLLGGFNSRLELDAWPEPDYSDYILAEYDLGTGCSMETSRGCTAQCSFCGEYQLWKFRSRSADAIVSELKTQKEKYGISRVWFVDSLINGNIKAFRELVDKMIEADLGISWNVYARCDGRMDKEFAKKVVAAGCSCLSWGVESGSQKVLDDMRKKIEIWEIEDNLRDFHEAGVANHVNYLIGFPTEEAIDFLHGITLIWNIGKWTSSISPGMGCGAPSNSDLALEWEKYGYDGFESSYDKTFLGTWFTKDYKNTMLHRMIRIKTVAILLEIMHKEFGQIDINGHRYSDVDKFYSLKYDKHKAVLNSYVKQLNNLDLNVFKENTLSSTSANEFIGIGYLLYNIINTGFELQINFNPAIDYINLGSFNAVDYVGTTIIKCDDLGNFNIEVDHTLNHESLSTRWKENVEKEKQISGDKSFKETLTFKGNFQKLLTTSTQVKDSVHPQYQTNRKPKIIEIKQVESV